MLTTTGHVSAYGPIPRPEESYRLWCVIVNVIGTLRMRRPWPALGCWATEEVPVWLRAKYFQELVTEHVAMLRVLLYLNENQPTLHVIKQNTCFPCLSHATLLKYTYRKLCTVLWGATFYLCLLRIFREFVMSDSWNIIYPSSGLLRGVRCFETEISALPIGSHLQESRCSKESVTLEDGTEM
jgi:hypothetical protein